MAVLGVILAAGRLRAVLQAGLLPGAPARDLRGLAGRDVLPWRLLGVILAMAFCGAPPQGAFLRPDGFVAPLCPLGIAAGRLGTYHASFTDAVTDLPVGMVFRGAGDAPRHPSQALRVRVGGLRSRGCFGGSRQPRPRGQVVGAVSHRLRRVSLQRRVRPGSPTAFSAYLAVSA